MSIFLKIALMAVVLAPLAILDFQCSRSSIQDLGFEGVVLDIDWKSKNHGLPLIEILDLKRNKKIVFSNYLITLKNGDLSVGDRIIKKKGSKECFINDVAIICIKD